MEQYLYIFGSTAIVSLVSLVGVFALSFRESTVHKFLFILISLAAGALFGDAFIHLIPEIFSETSNIFVASASVLSGILGFFILEKFLHWRHTHGTEECYSECAETKHETRIAPLGHITLVSDSMHNFIDGIIIAAGYMISIEAGIAVTIAVALHEIPQEIGDFAVLIHSGFSKSKALAINFATALFAILGSVALIIAGGFVWKIIPMAIGFAAGSFLYIAGSDLVPEIHKTKDLKKSLVQFIALSLGIAIMWLLTLIE